MIISLFYFWHVFHVCSKTCLQQNICLLKVRESSAVLHHHPTRKLLLSLHCSLSQCSSAEPQLCSRTKRKAQLLPWKDTASQKITSRGWHSVMRPTVPLASEQLQCLSHGRDLLAFNLLGLYPHFRAGRWEMKSQRNLSHCNLVLVPVREKFPLFPFTPVIWKELAAEGESYLKSIGQTTESKNWKCMRKQE